MEMEQNPLVVEVGDLWMEVRREWRRFLKRNDGLNCLLASLLGNLLYRNLGMYVMTENFCQFPIFVLQRRKYVAFSFHYMLFCSTYMIFQ